VVRSCDGDKVNSLVRRQLEFLLDHLRDRSIGSVRLDVVSGRRSLRLRWVRRKRAGHQLGAVVENRGRRMHATNERSLAATNQCHAQLAIECAVCRLHGASPVVTKTRLAEQWFDRPQPNRSSDSQMDLGIRSTERSDRPKVNLNRLITEGD